jgi:hypothetical protein
MPRKALALMIMLAAVVSNSADRLYGQVYGSNPVFSPWLNLYQRQAAPVDNYHAYVQPQMQLNNAIQGQQAQIQRNGAATDALADRQTAQQAFNATAAPANTAAGFLTQGGYFNTSRSGGSTGTGVFSSPGGARNNSNAAFGGHPGAASFGGVGAGLGMPYTPGIGGIGR